MPLFRKMLVSGEANLLPPALADRCQSAETETLTAGSTFQSWAEEDLAPALLGQFDLSVSQAKVASPGYRFREMRPGALALLDTAGLHDLVRELEHDRLGLSFEMANERGRTDRRYVDADNLDTGTIGEFLKRLWDLAQSLPNSDTLRQDLRGKASLLLSLEAALSLRIRDPHPLLESLSRAIRDVATVPR